MSLIIAIASVLLAGVAFYLPAQQCAALSAIAMAMSFIVNKLATRDSAQDRTIRIVGNVWVWLIARAALFVVLFNLVRLTFIL